MAQELTDRQIIASQESLKTPNIVLEFDELSTVYGSSPVRRPVRIGDAGLVIGEPSVNPNAFYVGQLAEEQDQKTLIDTNETTKSIRQVLNQDLGEGSSISSFQVALIDDGTLIDLMTPSVLLTDIMGQKVRVWYSLNAEGTSFPEDYFVIFRGYVVDTNTDAGKVVLTLNAAANKLKNDIFKVVDSELTAGISSGATTIPVTDGTQFLAPILGPDGLYDPTFESYVVINDTEIARYTGISGNDLTGVTRGQLGTTADPHSSGVQVSSRYRIKGGMTDISKKLFLSGFGGDFVEDLSVTNFQVIPDSNGGPPLVIANAVYFKSTSFQVKNNIQIGDYLTIVSATNGANNFTSRQIVDRVTTRDGIYFIVDGASLVSETASTALASFRSQYDTLPDGFGLTNDELDVEEFDRLFALFLSPFFYDFILKESIEGKEWVEKQIMSPVACYTLPRKGNQVSIGYHIGPIPKQEIKTFNSSNILNPNSIKVNRTTNRRFFNEIIYRYDEALFEDKFTRGYIAISEDSKNQIKGGARSLTIESKGMRQNLSGENIAQSQSLRRLDRYEKGAESLNIQTTFGDGFNVEIGDIVIFDGSDLNVIDIKKQKRGMEPRLFEVSNRNIDLSGKISFSLTDTGFDGSARRGLISPSSIIASGQSNQTFIIQQSFSSRFASDEYRKWSNLTRPAVVVRNQDGSVYETTVITSVNFNTITVEPLTFTPSAGMILEFSKYNDPNTTVQQKLVYGYMKDTDFDDGEPQYLML